MPEIILDGAARPLSVGVRGACFDLDGTLLESMAVWEEVDSEFFKKRRLTVPEGYFDAICSKSFNEAAAYTRERFALAESPEEIVREWHGTAARLFKEKVKIRPHAAEYLRYLASRQVPLAVATSLKRELFEPCLKANNVFSLFKAFATVDEVGKNKENPDVFIAAFSKLGIPAKDCLVFEDTLAGVKSAKKTGAAVVGVYDKYSEKFRLEIQAAADYYITDFSFAPGLD